MLPAGLVIMTMTMIDVCPLSMHIPHHPYAYPASSVWLSRIINIPVCFIHIPVYTFIHRCQACCSTERYYSVAGTVLHQAGTGSVHSSRYLISAGYGGAAAGLTYNTSILLLLTTISFISLSHIFTYHHPVSSSHILLSSATKSPPLIRLWQCGRSGKAIPYYAMLCYAIPASVCNTFSMSLTIFLPFIWWRASGTSLAVTPVRYFQR